MLAERGERLDESVELIKRALKFEPDNGSYLDSLGWAYFKGGKLDLAEEHLKRAADAAHHQLGRPGSLRRRARQAAALRRGDRRVEPRALRRRRLRSIAATSTGRSARPARNCRNDDGLRPGDPEPAEDQGTRRAAAVLAALLSTACGAPLMKLPSAPGAPAPTRPTR